ncbi:MAG TPA: hypothetical protein VML91_08100 [Burkholderiales bacterium]|nr:hypothetical protein [Burkholderiales bacterium]
MKVLLNASRYLVLAAVLGALAGAAALFGYGPFDTIAVIWRSAGRGTGTPLCRSRPRGTVRT